MSNDWYYVHQLAVLAGFKLVVLANRIGCEDQFLLELHDRLIEGLACAIAQVQSIIAWERQLAREPDEEGYTAFQLRGEEECLARFRINLLDDLEIDLDTHEYRVNAGEWHYALSADCDGIEISYPSLVALTNDDLGTLAPIRRAVLRGETCRLSPQAPLSLRRGSRPARPFGPVGGRCRDFPKQDGDEDHRALRPYASGIRSR